MDKLTVTTFVTLDGVMQASGGPTEDASGSFKSGGWVTWHNSTPVRDVGREVARSKQELDRDLQVHGSGGLAQTLFESDLVDELNLLVFPVALGRGKRVGRPTCGTIGE